MDWSYPHSLTNLPVAVFNIISTSYEGKGKPCLEIFFKFFLLSSKRIMTRKPLLEHTFDEIYNFAGFFVLAP